MKITEYSIIIPVYNTTKVLVQLVDQIKKVFDGVGEEYEIILVNDHSPNPESWNVIRTICSSEPKVKGVQLSRNFGQQSATMCGLSLARGRYVITMDDDGQHNPKHIPLLIEQQIDHEIVIAHLQSKKHSFSKRFLSRIKGHFDRIILGKPKGIQLSAFRLLSRNVVDGMLSIKTPTPFIPALMFYVSKDVKSVPVPHEKRVEGKTGYTLFKLIKLFSFLLINNSSLLLRYIGNVGLTVSGASILFIFYLFLQKILNDTALQGWTSTIVLILFFGGLQLFAIGVIGEYLIRIIRNVEEKPAFHIKEILNK